MTEGTPRFTITRINDKRILTEGFVNNPEGMELYLERDPFVFPYKEGHDVFVGAGRCIFDLFSEGHHLAFVTVRLFMPCSNEDYIGPLENMATLVWFNLADNLAVLEEMGKKDAE